MRLLVTGGAGFIGSNFLKMILRSNSSNFSSLTVLDNLSYAGNLNNFTNEEKAQFEFIKGDISDKTVIDRILPRIDIIVNFAAESHVDRSIEDANPFFNSNLLGVFNLLEGAHRHGIELFIQISTDEVYGSIDEGHADESYLLNPRSPYSSSKAAAELLSFGYVGTHQLPVIITRSSNNYGPNQFLEKLIPLAITNILKEQDVPIYGAGNQVRDWIHVDDNCEAILKIIENGVIGNIYNISGRNEMKNIDLVQMIMRNMNPSVSKIRHVEDRKGHDFRYAINSAKLEKEIGFIPKISLEDGIRETIEWYKENSGWWNLKAESM
jgi:dTDP-glucose 4,6-dehydratase